MCVPFPLFLSISLSCTRIHKGHRHTDRQRHRYRHTRRHTHAHAHAHTDTHMHSTYTPGVVCDHCTLKHIDTSRRRLAGMRQAYAFILTMGCRVLIERDVRAFGNDCNRLRSHLAACSVSHGGAGHNRPRGPAGASTSQGS